MITRSLQQTGLSSKRSESLKTHNPQPSAPLRDDLPVQNQQLTTQSRQARSHLQQTYALERRVFL